MDHRPLTLTRARLTRATLPAVVALSLVVGCGGGSNSAAPGTGTSGTTAEQNGAGQWAGAALGEPRAVPPFLLTDQDGNRIGPQSFPGKAVLITFLYVHCPDVCPLIASNLNIALQGLDPAQRRDVRVLAVSVDPKGDTPKSVEKFVRERTLVPEFRYLIGGADELTKVWRKYDVQAVRKDPEEVDHVAYTLLVDPAGKGIVIYDAGVQAKDVLHDLRQVLAS